MNFRFTTVLVAAFLCGTPALAGPKADVLHDFARCTQITDNIARLACFDALAPRAKAAIAPPAVAAVPPQAPSAPPAPLSAPPPKPAPLAPTPTAKAKPPPKEEQESWFGRNVGDLFDIAPDQQTTPEKFGADELPRPAPPKSTVAGKRIDSITAKLDNYAFTPIHKFIVFLDNGQVWRQLDGDGGRARFKDNPKDNTVKISRGFMGSYNLVLNGEGLVFKVKRIK